MNVRGVKARVRNEGGRVTHVDHIEVGRKEVAQVEAYFDGEVPEFPTIEFGDRVTVDYEWDDNGVLFEVEL